MDIETFVPLGFMWYWFHGFTFAVVWYTIGVKIGAMKDFVKDW